MGKPKDPEYFRKWRAAHPEYRAREAQRLRVRSKGDRSGEYQRRAARQAILRRPDEPLPQLYEHLRRGRALSFWEDELRMDLEQERHLALLEGRDPELAMQLYKRREVAWRMVSAPFLFEQEPPVRDTGGEGPMAW